MNEKKQIELKLRRKEDDLILFDHFHISETFLSLERIRDIHFLEKDEIASYSIFNFVFVNFKCSWCFVKEKVPEKGVFFITGNYSIYRLNLDPRRLRYGHFRSRYSS